MRLAERTNKIAPSATLATTARAKAMRAEGVDVLALSAGEPDFDTPENICEAAREALARGDTRYSPVAGIPKLRAAIAAHAEQLYGNETAPEQVIVGAGAKQVLFNACACLLQPGDEAVYASPFWVSYPDMVRFAGGEPRIIHTDESCGFLPTAEQLDAACNDKTRLLILNSPSNPTGAAFSRAQLEGLAQVLRTKPNVTIVTDDIYYSLVYDGEFAGIAQIAPDLAERTLIVSGVSKAYAMTGWRVGWGIGPKVLIDAMSRLQGASTSGANTIAQAAALEALEGEQTAHKEMTQAFAKRREHIVQALQSIPDLRIFAPKGSFYVFPRVDSYYGERVNDSNALCKHLLDTVHLAVVPGAAFGADGYIRLSFACSERSIDEGVERLRKGLKALR